MEINKNIFREYDIRGIWEEDINEELSYLIGRAFGTKCKEYNINTTTVAHDNRLSSPIIYENVVKGIIESGVNVLGLKLATTPMCYFAANYLNTNSSMMITASHNPKEYNGYKFSYNGIHNACGKSVIELYDIIMSNRYTSGKGTYKEVNINDAYINLVIDKLNFGNRKIKIVYDPGNGTTSIIADKIFDKIKDKVEAIPICNISDGSFPSHHPDPCIYENLTMLKQKVLETHADFGIGYDGDGDRVGIIDELGNMIDIDKYLIIMWRDLYKKTNIKKCLYDVKCSKSLEDELIKLGIKPLEYRTGNSYTRKKSYEENCPLSGELSGHIYFRDKWPGYDDGIYCGMRLIELLSNTTNDTTLSSLLNGINKYYSTSEEKYKVKDENKFEIVNKIKEYAESKGYKYNTLDGVKTKFDDGFALVRASNTGPNITTRFEAKTEQRLKEISNEFINVLNNIIKEYN